MMDVCSCFFPNAYLTFYDIKLFRFNHDDGLTNILPFYHLDFFIKLIYFHFYLAFIVAFHRHHFFFIST